MNKSSSTPADQQAGAVATADSVKDSEKTASKKSSTKTTSARASKASEKSATAAKPKTASTRSKTVKKAAEPTAEAPAAPESAEEKKPRAKRASAATKTPENADADSASAAKAKPKAASTAKRKSAAAKSASAEADATSGETAEKKPRSRAASAAKTKSPAATTAQSDAKPDAVKTDAIKPEGAKTDAVDSGVEPPAAAAKTPAKSAKAAPRKKTAAKTSTPKTADEPAPVTQEAREETVAAAAQPEAAEPAKVDSAAKAAETPEKATDDATPEKPAARQNRGRRGGRRDSAKKAEARAEAATDAVQGQAAQTQPPAASVEEALPEAPEREEISEAASASRVQESDAQQGGEQTEKSGARERGERNGRRKHKNGRDRSDRHDEKSRNGQTEREDAVETAKDAPKGKRKMFVSVLPGEQVEVVIAEEGVVQEYYVEMLHQVKVKGNIYKGVIHNVDPNLQAAFVSYGAVKNGFLQIDEVHPEYYLAPHEQGKGHKYPLIQKVLKPGQEILVQVVKEPSGTKGAFLTSYLSLPGRFLVLTPGREQIGVSRKVENDEERGRLRETLSGLNPGPGLGVIVRTVSMGAGKTNLQRDLQFLKRVWRDVRKKGSTEKAPALIYQELGLAARAVRDYLTEDVVELWVDDQELAEQIKEVIAMLFPRRSNLLQLHNAREQDLFERFGLKKQIEQVHSREVVLPSGARLVFDHTEALTAIDINSGKTAGKTNFEDMAFRINLEAAQNIPLQLRLRDIGGQIVVDFIEMRDRNHWREVERAFRNAMRHDRARHDVAKISSFGLLQVVRQRLGSSAISIATELCPCCRGTGQRRNMEWQSLQALKEIQRLIRQNGDNSGKTIHYSNQAELILYLLNHKKERLLDMEKSSGLTIELKPES